MCFSHFTRSQRVSSGPEPAAVVVAVSHLERLHESPEENADGVALAEEFDESGSTEEAEKAQVDEVILRR